MLRVRLRRQRTIPNPTKPEPPAVSWLERVAEVNELEWQPVGTVDVQVDNSELVFWAGGNEVVIPLG